MTSSLVAGPSSPPYLSALTLRCFRSHDVFELAPGPGLIALVGPNGVGKTNVLEAISALTPGRGLRGASADDMVRRQSPIGWSVSATLREPGGDAALSVLYDPSTRRRTARIDGAVESQTAIARRLRLIWLTPAMDRLWIEGASGRRKFLDRLTLAFDPGHGERSALYERAMRERNRLLKEPSPEKSWLDALEARLAETGLAISQARAKVLQALAAADGEQSLQAFPAADLTLEGPVEASGDQVKDAYAARLRGERRSDAAAGRTRFGPHRSDLTAMYRAKAAPAAQCSTGEQKALLLWLTLTAARALTSAFGAAPIVLLDEIAAHLDPARRGALFAALERSGAQVWMTGAQSSDFEDLADRAEIHHLTAADQAA